MGRGAEPELPISVVIPCASDRLLQGCLDSIDANVEVIVVLNAATRPVEEIAERWQHQDKTETARNRRVESLPQPNLSAACNRGFELASRPYVFLMNSDCTFKPGALQAMARIIQRSKEANDGIEVFRCGVEFEHTGGRSLIVATNRHYQYSVLQKLYQPGILIDKNKIEARGGLFKPGLRWTEDAEFSRRMLRNNAKCEPVQHIMIAHVALRMRDDLKSAFNYGRGRRMAERQRLRGPASPKSKHHGKWNHFRHLLVTLYSLIPWYVSFKLGYWYECWVPKPKTQSSVAQDQRPTTVA
jgi:glycosyltransferase involved in cell wall biosynthesis